MRIVIDMQGAQGESRLRGIGRYTMSLSQAMVRNRGEHEIILALSGLLPDTIEPIRAAFDDLLPQENIRVWCAPDPAGYFSEPKWRRDIAEHIREYFIAHLKPDMVLVSSLLDGLGDNTVTSIGRISCKIPTAVILYDLIPYIHRIPYLENPIIEGCYLNKLDHLRRADLLLSISEASRQEGIRYLGVDERSVINISTAADAQFSARNITPSRWRELRERYGLKRPLVMYTGGIDHRKNVEGLICAYAGLPKDIRRQHQLALVCSIQEHDRRRLVDLAEVKGLKTHDLIITGFVPEEDLIDLYNLCTVFVFPSWHEGFGLPALEAMSCGAPVIGANTSSLPEVIGREDALFDPHDDEDITAKLSQVLTDEAFRQALAQHGLEQMRRFSWDTTAKRALSAFEQWHRERGEGSNHRRWRPPKAGLYIATSTGTQRHQRLQRRAITGTQPVL
jgi:glycosyltransferase involved in cell wall biosynthesis